MDKSLLEPDFSESPFYFTKKDTQIRKQLVNVLHKDKALIIDAWNLQIKEHSTKSPMSKVSTTTIVVFVAISDFPNISW